MIHHLIAAGGRHTVGLRADGTVVAIERQREDYEKLAAFCVWGGCRDLRRSVHLCKRRDEEVPCLSPHVQDYEAGLIDAIVVYNLDRLTC